MEWTCSYCGRPIVGGPAVSGGNGNMYHPECTRGPGYQPETFSVPMEDPAALRRRIEALEARVLKLECSPMASPVLGPRIGQIHINGVPQQEG